jgi:hypothetical protein
MFTFGETAASYYFFFVMHIFFFFFLVLLLSLTIIGSYSTTARRRPRPPTVAFATSHTPPSRTCWHVGPPPRLLGARQQLPHDVRWRAVPMVKAAVEARAAGARQDEAEACGGRVADQAVEADDDRVAAAWLVEQLLLDTPFTR